RAAAALPRVRAVVGAATLDVFGHEQAVALLNGLAYHPRPVFQGYSAYTPDLARLNQRFYASADAPEFVLFQLQSIDGRLPALDDSLALRELLRRSEPVLSEGGFTLLKRGVASAAAPPAGRREARTLELGAPIDLCDLGPGATWVEISAPLSALGRLRSLLLKPPMAHLELVQRGGRSQVFRLPLAEAETGFLVNPLLTAGARFPDAKALARGSRVGRLRVTVAAEDRDFFRGDVSVALASDASGGPSNPARGPRAGSELDPRAATPFAVFRSRPAEYHARASAAAGRIDGTPVAVVHAPSGVGPVPPPGRRLVRGSLGLLPEAYLGAGRTDGVIFRVVWWHAGHREVLFERLLDPLRSVADRGLVRFAVAFDGRDGGAIDLEADPGPRGDDAF